MALNPNTLMDNKEDTLSGRYLLVAIGEEVYGIEIRLVTEIIKMQTVSKLPETPLYIKGVINLRGKIIPVIDMRLRFQKEDAGYTDRTCIVVIEAQAFSAGLIVDEVTEVISIAETDIVPPPKFEVGVSSRYISGIGKVKDEVKLLLDCEKLFTDEEAWQLESIKEGDIKI